MTTNREETDLYEILGCDELSSQEQIIAEYKIRARALHPDKIPESGNRDATEKFITLTKAKEILCDDQKRKYYDNWRHSGLDVSFDFWLSKLKSNHMTMHWAQEPHKQHMIGPDHNEEKKSSITGDENIEKMAWRKSSIEGRSQLRKFRNYKS
ncbi:J domain-containing protein-like [Xenia sp. Carnegie-2017]|uniref:J domain-containing protein-like n=1 Tax=Xenia sp. Carnegie-2017 TaxID=2897299 RepID=UPI001F03F4C2|nr:J domain-containing protein-like [Xenia sp. Carnegie-2017]